ncbi:hypothetical protein [Streptomyces sp. NBC_01304]|uniref:hypothetical protein n=1 Tax=Streptomyces sp. NBC_01304 TaxID=2903818 RepID=UPI002E15B1EF|nr:hypothetical protein OG430_44635 [Streptomyces sp. NBC_01304]
MVNTSLYDSHGPIRAIAETSAKDYTGKNMRIRPGGAIHAWSAATWRGVRVPAPICHVGSFADVRERGTPEWQTVTCGRPGCRDMQGFTGRQVAAAIALQNMSLHRTLTYADGTSETFHTTAYQLRMDPNERVRDGLYQVTATHVRDAVAEFDAAFGVAAYAEQIATERAQARGLLFDVA